MKCERISNKSFCRIFNPIIAFHRVQARIRGRGDARVFDINILPQNDILWISFHTISASYLEEYTPLRWVRTWRRRGQPIIGDGKYFMTHSLWLVGTHNPPLFLGGILSLCGPCSSTCGGSISYRTVPPPPWPPPWRGAGGRFRIVDMKVQNMYTLILHWGYIRNS